MPGIEDITRELNRVKGELFKTRTERDLNLKLLKHSRNQAELAELMGAVYLGAVEWVVDMVTRNSLPGIGEGGGLTPRGYEHVAKKVEQEMKKLSLHMEIKKDISGISDGVDHGDAAGN